MTTGPTPRQLDCLAAWWRSGGSNTGAATLLGITSQRVRNLLLEFRKVERAETNLLLALRYRDLIEKRRVARRKAA